MTDIFIDVQNHIINYTLTNNIPVDLRFACFGDENKFYTNGTDFSLTCVPYFTDDIEDIKEFFTLYLDKMWESCTPPMNRLALYIEDIVDMDSWYEVIVGGGIFIDEALL